MLYIIANPTLNTSLNGNKLITLVYEPVFIRLSARFSNVAHNDVLRGTEDQYRLHLSKYGEFSMAFTEVERPTIPFIKEKHLVLKHKHFLSNYTSFTAFKNHFWAFKASYSVKFSYPRVGTPFSEQIARLC